MLVRGFLFIRSDKKWRCSAFAVMAVFLATGVLRAQTSESPLSGLLPDPSGLDGWVIKDEAQAYEGDDLYLYIDGGAEIYREYGFAEVLVQEYKDREGKNLSLEIFRMTSPEGAYGMYTFKRSPQGTPVSIGAEGHLDDYYLNFWKGYFLVTITGQDESPATRRGLLELARAVAGKIQGPSDPALLVSELPQPGLIKTSVRYFKGYLGFMNNYPSLGKEAFRFQEGVRGDYSSGASLFILKYPSEESLRRDFPAVEQAFNNDPKSREFRSGDGLSLQVIDDRGKLLSLQAVRNLLLLCIEDRASAGKASGLFETIRKNH